MSSGNKLSISICDDNGNLSYQKQFSVRRVIKRGALRAEKNLLVPYTLSPYSHAEDEEVYDEYKNGTGKWLLVVKYEGADYNETEVYMPYLAKFYQTGNEIELKGDTNIPEYYNGYGGSPVNFKAGNYYYFMLGVSGEEKYWLQDNPVIHALKAYGEEEGDFSIIDCKVIISDEQLYIQPNGEITYDHVNFAYIRNTFKGRRWTAILPYQNLLPFLNPLPYESQPLITDDVAVFTPIIQRKGKGKIEYYIVEVE